MSATLYQLSNENITVEFSNSIDTMIRAIESNLSPAPQHKKNRLELNKLEAIRSLYICNFSQGESCYNWHKYFQMDAITYNEALCLLLGVIPSAVELISDDLSSIVKESDVHHHLTSYMFFREDANQLLIRKFKDVSVIESQEFILWALDKGLILKSINGLPESKQRSETIKIQTTVNILAREIKIANPGIKKEWLADDISNRLESEYNIARKPSTIERRFLKNWKLL